MISKCAIVTQNDACKLLRKQVRVPMIGRSAEETDSTQIEDQTPLTKSPIGTCSPRFLAWSESSLAAFQVNFPKL